MLQSGSIFGGLQGLELIDAHNLNAAEGALLAELLPHADPGAVAIALVSFGSLPASLSKAVKAVAEVVTMKKQYERQAGDWLADEIRRRGTEIDASGTAALQQRFGSDTAAMGQALDQLAAFPGKISRDVVLARFRNRPDEPTFHYTDAVAAGRVGEALRRLADFLTHSHPLILVAALETDLRRRALAAAAPDQQTFYKWIGATASDRRPERLWRDRGKVADSSLRKALDALVRADRILKTQPEDLHQVTLERLTVALARWYGK
jgi:DNA polymerase III delta subunit